eukprot:gnl/Chilomastix_cuspidata/7807.p3 GENE.gnl/Chilomastix_cuspidata/7807~~gnl/Chilomastix_cuspidata/7807.p3  ORF type:complete len:122 (+),score=4.49 gnl/Chilomastix_cuspidata/7807:806-1171(+)
MSICFCIKLCRLPACCKNNTCKRFAVRVKGKNVCTALINFIINNFNLINIKRITVFVVSSLFRNCKRNIKFYLFARLLECYNKFAWLTCDTSNKSISLNCNIRVIFSFFDKLPNNRINKTY